MRYFKVDSEEQAAKISASLYSCMCPEGSQTIYLFGWRVIAGIVVLVVPEITQPTNEKSSEKLADAREVMKTDQSYDSKMTNPVEVIKMLEGLEEITEKFVIDNSPKDAVQIEIKK